MASFPSGSVEVDVILDTGFHGSLSLPISMAQKLGLPQSGVVQARLADGSTIVYPIFIAQVEWSGVIRTVVASAMGDECLMGMRFLENHELQIKIELGGSVLIVPL